MCIDRALKTIVRGMVLLGVGTWTAGIVAEEPTRELPLSAASGGESAIVLRLEQLPRLLDSPDIAAWNPQVNQEMSRDPFAGDVYEKVAPATVVVRTGQGHGSGFFIDPDGWLVTNHHVISRGGVDLQTGAQVAMIHLGRLKDGGMELLDTPIPALVYKTSEDQDLALLKLIRLPEGWEEVPFLTLASQVPRPGQRCLTVAHPTAGMLWTLRSGLVSSAGIWPHDMLHVVMRRLGLEEESHREDFQQALDAKSRMKVLLSECGLNPGDSGGPLVNQGAELIAVNFAIPLMDRERGIHLGKFSYHVHLHELQEFLTDRPAEPLVYVPEAWPAGLSYRLRDLDQDGLADTLFVAMKADSPPTAILLDLDQRSTGAKLEILNVKAIVETRTWNFQFALHLAPQRRTFYDTNHDGTLDLIMQDVNGNGIADLVLQRADGTWVRGEPAGRPLLDPSLIQDEPQAKRLRHILKILQQ